MIDCVMMCFRRTVRKTVGVDIQTVKPVNSILKVRVPMFIFAGKADRLSKAVRVKEVFDRAASEEKVFYMIEGDHMAERDETIIAKAVGFILKKVMMEEYFTMRRNM